MSERHPDGQTTVEQRGHILLMGLDRPEKRNGLTPKMVKELTERVHAARPGRRSCAAVCSSGTGSTPPRDSTCPSGTTR